MRAGIALIARPPENQPPGSGLQWVTRFGTLAEKTGFAGVWVTDSMGRGRHTLDPAVTLDTYTAAYDRVREAYAAASPTARPLLQRIWAAQHTAAIFTGVKG